jgi:hypothetical protein
MYSERRILEKLDRFTKKYGWTPVRHSIEEVEKVNAYFKTLNTIGKDGAAYFDDEQWTPRLKEWVQNERAMCAIDCEYFLTRYYFIAADNEIKRFTFRSGQRAFYRVVQELESDGVSIEIQVLKARQLGISTLVEGMMCHRALFVPGVKCAIASANDQKTYVMMGMMYTAMEHLPWWLPPTQTKDKRSGAAILEFAHVGTQVVVQSGSMRGGAGQGTTPTAVHFSEVCDWTDPVVQIEEGLFKAVHPSPEIFMVLESTGNGNTGWWADQWRNNKEFYYQGRARMLPLFLPWFTTPELYPSAHWLRKYPINGGQPNWKPASETVAMTAKCEAYVRATPILQRILGKDWKLPPEQQWFWEFNFQDAKRRRKEKSWFRQMPCDDYEALTGENDSVFEWEVINAIQARRKRGFEVYGILGEGIAEKHDPPPAEVDPRLPRLSSDWRTPRGERLEWVFMPLFADSQEKGHFDPLKKLCIFEHPQKNADYSIGVDTGTGVGGDRTILSVTKTGRDEFPDVQVAEFSSDDISTAEAYAYVAAIASYYGMHMEEGKHPKLIIEQRRKYGDLCQHVLKRMGFHRHHEFGDGFDKKTFSEKVGSHGRLGWFTNAWSRPLLLGSFKHAVDNGWYEVHSRWLLEEIEGFEQKTAASGTTRMDHASGKHDDRIFAAAMSYFTMHQSDVMAERAKKKFNMGREEGYEVDYSPWTGVRMMSGAEDFFELA